MKFFDEQCSSKAMKPFYLDRQNSLITIAKYETEISIKKVSESPSIKCTQFPLTLTWISTVRKVQGLSLSLVTRCH